MVLNAAGRLEADMRYILKKTAILILTMFLISGFTFLAFHIIPGDPAQLILGTSASPEQLEALRHQLGTDLPLYRQYIQWITGFLHGDFGTSIRYSMPVASLLQGHLAPTLILGAMVIAATLLLGIPLGILGAHKRDSLCGHILSLLDMIGISFPEFFLSILLMWIFGLILHLFTPGQYVDYGSDPAGFFRFMIFPAAAIAIPQTAILAKYVRTAVIEELGKDYVRTAKGKGSTMQGILYSHVLKNAIVSIVPLIGMMIGSIFSGSIIIEQVFGIPGVGRLLISSVSGRDFPLTETIVMYIALIIVLTNFAVDIVIQWIDPRIRLNG